jgi:hypothetical protein
MNWLIGKKAFQEDSRVTLQTDLPDLIFITMRNEIGRLIFARIVATN